ncbi:MAG TPA: RNA polymerase subunit sigma-70 [Streptosporangiaceae bacterium]|jgi:RNA polymerase sigma-70 factor (ECF subfamily)
MSSALASESGFASVSERHRRELHLHCYRMLASFDEAEDAVQEALLRAWRSRDSLDDASMARSWLYRIATNVCLDTLRGRSRRVSTAPAADVPWLQPYPDALLDAAAPADDEPDALAVRRETIELAFLVALQVLPPRQRAALITRDVLGWPATHVAGLLGTSVAAANSAVQRGRAAMQQHLPPRRDDWSAAEPSAAELELLGQFIDAHQRCDSEAAAAIAARDIRITMPPLPMCFRGLEEIAPLLEHALGDQRDGEWRLLPARVNRMPAAASYLLRRGDSQYRALKLDVLRISDGQIAEITTFGTEPFERLGLPPVL